MSSLPGTIQWGLRPNAWEWGHKPEDDFSFNTLGLQWVFS